MPRVYTTAPVDQRFWSKVEKTDDCWIWRGGQTPHGYGVFWLTSVNQNVRAHRLAWELTHGPVPPGLNVLHTCDNPACVNPAHLFLGTHADNVADKVAKDRQAKGLRNGRHTHPEASPRGEANGSAKLTEADVLEIRRLYAHEGHTQTALAKQFGVHYSQISQIVLGKKWAHLPVEPTTFPFRRRA